MTRLDAVSASLACIGGDLLASTVVELMEPGRDMIRRSGGEWCLDMADVDRVSSAAVALLLDWMRTAQQADVSMTVRAVPERLLPILRISDLEGLFAEILVAEA
ncbi:MULTISPECIES: lipid asymmetry maintenance protein MlaB [unclassified Oceanobacter]|uniref:STAS domain-containing protein n=1 Tax=unclassified Oceanobacter TaxID=2620260 RepID=UPI0026E25B43|nr:MULTISPECIES: STAS domain-containing protein [unclassified Oceanobacter]MDO6681976.1 STAS domain-containing protein [Oceanobacter sp. 5_MG-2023]MDP2505338.1 STAS domain-containing protein [Oceanobacter sp. 3_MG-2023]MDP2610134.1 STAS domain-containing protein [Oceanobacter sp. 1_MG-2023]MDP2612291.1 STAS domain-containing protein [Oceanobacter sp. 2_MG-2023]